MSSGSREAACLTQGLWCNCSEDAAKHHLKGGVEVCPVSGVKDYGVNARFCPERDSYRVARDGQDACAAFGGAWWFACGEEGPPCNSHCGDVEENAEVQSEASAARVVKASGVYE